MSERMETINIESLIPFKNHPFKNRNGMEQAELIDSIRSGGLPEPLLVVPFRNVNMRSSAVTGELPPAGN